MGCRRLRVPAVAATLLVCLTSAVAAAEPPEGDEARGQTQLVLFFRKALVGPEMTPVEVTGDIQVGKAATKGHLEYPPDVLAEGIGGTVEVAILVDELGRVTSARILRGVDPRLDALCLEAARGISFGPSRSKDGRPVGLAVMAAYSFIPGGTPEAKPGAGLTPGWETQFKRAYALNEGEVLKLVRPPFPPSRMDFYRTSNPGQAKAIPEGPSQMTVRWDGESGRLECEGLRFGGSDLEGLLLSLGVARYATSADPGLLGAEVRCDLVVRKGATAEECAPALENVLRTEFRLPVRMTFKDEEREVIVARGSYALCPPQNVGDKGKVQIFDRDLDTSPGHAALGTTSVAGLLEVLAETLQCTVVSEVEPTHARVTYVVNRDASRTAYVDDVLRNVTAQTGLVFTRQTRTVCVFHLDRVE